MKSSQNQKPVLAMTALAKLASLAPLPLVPEWGTSAIVLPISLQAFSVALAVLVEPLKLAPDAPAGAEEGLTPDPLLVPTAALVTREAQSGVWTATGDRVRYVAVKTGAARGEKKQIHRIDPATCIQCGACYDACRFDAIEIR